ncbi:MAG: beta-ketoacyl-ACP synthase III [Gammaproteobacteria bacterium]
MYSKLISTGAYLPEQILKNQDLPAELDTSDEWIQQRVGIHARHVASGIEDTAYMAHQAAEKALKKANLSSKDIDLIIVATCTGPKVFPSTACLVQEKLGIQQDCPAFDVQAACSGFLYAWQQADLWIRSGDAKTALVIGSETMSRVLDWQDRATCVLFGDGAAAVLLQASDKPGILGTKLGADGKEKNVLSLDNPYMNNMQKEQASYSPFLYMEGNKVFKFAVQKLESLARGFLEARGLTIEDIDWLVPHQANVRIIQATAEKLGLPMSKVILTLKEQGNTSAASVPLALTHGIEQNLIKPGHKVLIEAIGGGMTWGVSLFEY